MSYIKYLFVALLIVFPISLYAGPPVPEPNGLEFMDTYDTDEEAFAYYDLRNRKTYIQVTNDETEDSDALPTLCLHIQIFQQDKGCSELNFEDELTPNDTVVYDMDNLVRNDGSPVPVNLDDDSYGYVAISAYECGNRDNDDVGNPLFGNVRIIDDSGYEYRMNLVTEHNDRQILEEGNTSPYSFPIIRFNTLDGANQADIVGFVFEENRNLAGSDEGPTEDLVFNVDEGVTFSVFQVDENEERLSCDTKTFACGPGSVMNYGINEDYPNSRGGPLLCEGASLLPGQTHGYISLENPVFTNTLVQDEYEFFCAVGLNNGDGTGSMDTCSFKCVDDDGIPENCQVEE